MRIRPNIAQFERVHLTKTPTMTKLNETTQKWLDKEEYFNNPPIDRHSVKFDTRICSLEEIDRMNLVRSFVMPTMRKGDLVTVRYEISRSRQTYATFTGYVIKLNGNTSVKASSTFRLRNTVGGIGVEQSFPYYSPRILDVKVDKRSTDSIHAHSNKHTSANYRYRFHRYMRGMYSPGFKYYTNIFPQKIGVFSLEPFMNATLLKIRKKRQHQRKRAGLPPYIWPGPYPIFRRYTREVLAEKRRRQLIYAADHRRIKERTEARRQIRYGWGSNKIKKDSVTTALTRLPSYHPLAPGVLPM